MPLIYSRKTYAVDLSRSDTCGLRTARQSRQSMSFTFRLRAICAKFERKPDRVVPHLSLIEVRHDFDGLSEKSKAWYN